MLQRIGVAAIPRKKITIIESEANIEQLSKLLNKNLEYFVIKSNDSKAIQMVKNHDLKLALSNLSNTNETVDLLNLPMPLQQLSVIPVQATLKKALQTINEDNTDVHPILQIIEREVLIATARGNLAFGTLG